MAQAERVPLQLVHWHCRRRHEDFRHVDPLSLISTEATQWLANFDIVGVAEEIPAAWQVSNGMAWASIIIVRALPLKVSVCVGHSSIADNCSALREKSTVLRLDATHMCMARLNVVHVVLHDVVVEVGEHDFVLVVERVAEVSRREPVRAAERVPDQTLPLARLLLH